MDVIETTRPLAGLKVGIFIESDFYEPEIWYYQHRFLEEGIELHWLTRLWGQKNIVFQGHENHVPISLPEESLEEDNLTDEKLRSFAAVIVPSGIVADRLRYTEDVSKWPPATAALQRFFGEKNILKGIICHGLWLCAPAPELVRNRRLVVHNNLYGDARNMGAIYVDSDVVVDDDLVTARTGGHCHLLARTLIDLLTQKQDLARSAS
jgi:protease I